MKRLQTIGFVVLWGGLVAAALAAPSVYPTGTTVYDPDRAFGGYTVLSPLNTRAVIVIDMNGTVVKSWEDANNSAGGPARVLPGGQVVTAVGARPPHQESLALEQRDFAGNVVWRFDRNEKIEGESGNEIWSARQHHDWQRSDFPAGYYSPAFSPGVRGARTLVLTHTNRMDPAIANVMLEEDRLLEIGWDGEILWEWTVGEHIDEFNYDAVELAGIRAASGFNARRGSYDWFHLNSATYVGPNRWFDAGDERFDPDNVIISSRQSSVLAIVARDGSVVWQIGPDFSETAEMRAIGQIIGQHHVHMIPPGLPGAGNMLIFDNGGSSGYGAPSAIALNGLGIYARAFSRIVEINPVTLERVWTYVAPGQFFSTNISGAQRLPNGNTLITEGASGRMFEVTTEGEIVWEYMYPEFSGPRSSNTVYRAYRVPYDWIPQLEHPREVAIVPPPLGEFSVPAR